jgi:hypothetical protein
MTLDNKEEFNDLMLKRVANVAISAGTAQKMGPVGTVNSARIFLSEKNNIKTLIEAKDTNSFTEALDITTDKLLQKLPREAAHRPTGRHWGSARKFLNIFLRDCFYNYDLRNEYTLAKWEPWLEIPLDSHVANGIIKNSAEKDDLPPWSTVIGLAKNSGLYQDAAAKIARDIYKTHRIHLDLVYWRQPNP